MKQIVVAGHSMGAQVIFASTANRSYMLSNFFLIDVPTVQCDWHASFNHRQVAFSNEILGSLIQRDLVPILYWIGNPDSFAWLNSSRPVAPGTCTTYDDWEWGLSNYTETQTYNQGIVALGVGAVQSNLAAKNVAYARGLNDHGDYGEGCDPYSQG